MKELCSEDRQKLILALPCDKKSLTEKVGIALPRLNELLLLFKLLDIVSNIQ